MRRKSLVVVEGVVAVCVGLAAQVVWAELLRDLYLGAALTQDVERTLSVPLGNRLVSGRFETAFTLGKRVGHYFERFLWSDPVRIDSVVKL